MKKNFYWRTKVDKRAWNITTTGKLIKQTDKVLCVSYDDLGDNIDDSKFHTFFIGKFTKINDPLEEGQLYTFKIKGADNYINLHSVTAPRGDISDKGYLSGVLDDVNIDEEGEYIKLGKTVIRNLDNVHDLNPLRNLIGEELTMRVKLESIEKTPQETYTDSLGQTRTRRKTVITLY